MCPRWARAIRPRKARTRRTQKRARRRILYATTSNIPEMEAKITKAAPLAAYSAAAHARGKKSKKKGTSEAWGSLPLRRQGIFLSLSLSLFSSWPPCPGRSLGGDGEHSSKVGRLFPGVSGFR